MSLTLPLKVLMITRY